MDRQSEKKKKKNRDLMIENSSDKENGNLGFLEVIETQESGDCEDSEERKKKKKNKDSRAENSLNKELENSGAKFREVAESGSHGSREGGKKKKKRNKDLEAENRVDKELEDENRGAGFREMSETQDSGGHASVERGKRKKKKNKYAKSDNFDENGYQESSGRKEKKNAGIETEVMSGKSSKKRKSKGLLDSEIEESPSRYKGSEKDNFNENLMEKKASEYSGSETDSFIESSIKRKNSKYNGSKNTWVMEDSVRSEAIKEEHIAEKEKKKKKKRKHGLGEVDNEEEIRNLMEENLREKFEESVDKSLSAGKSICVEEGSEKSSGEGPAMKEKPYKKKKKKNRADCEESVAELHNSDESTIIERAEEDSVINKKRPAKKKKNKRAEVEEIEMEPQGNISNVAAEEEENPDSSEKAKNKEKKKRKRKEREMVSSGDKSGKDAEKYSTDGSPLHKKQKKVTFSNEVQMCGTEERTEKEFSEVSGDAGGISDKIDEQGQKVWGKRFGPEEDQAIRDAISKYIKEHGLDEDEGLHIILNCNKYPKVRNCWKEIAAALPWRPCKTVYNRGHLLYERSDERCWTQDEIDELRRLHNEEGRKWKKISEVLGKSRYHVKDKWRAIKRGVMNRGPWSQDEYQRLFDLVNYNKRLKLTEKEQESTHRKRRDNLNWEAIADKMETRNHAFCCSKWYRSFVSSLIEAGLWESGDDEILLRRLLETNACDEEAVDWDDLVNGRPGKICLMRWKQMVKHLGEYSSKPFCEKLDLVVKRFAPELIE